MVTSFANRFLGSFWILIGLLIGGVALAYLLLFERAVSSAANLLGGNQLVVDFIAQRLGGPGYLNWWGLGLAIFLILLGARMLMLAPVARPVAMAFHLLAGYFILFITVAAYLVVRGAGIVGTVLTGASTTILIILVLVGGLLIAAGLALGTRQAAEAFAPPGGAALLAAKSPSSSTGPVVTGPSARLVRSGSPDVYTLRPDMGVIGIGRDAAQAIVLDESSVSERHAKIEFRDGEYLLSDQKSTNGTFVNGQRLKVADHVLRPNDDIAIGRVHLRFEL